MSHVMEGVQGLGEDTRTLGGRSDPERSTKSARVTGMGRRWVKVLSKDRNRFLD